LWLTLALFAFWTTEQAGATPRPERLDRPSAVHVAVPKPDPSRPLRKGNSSSERPVLKAQPYPRLDPDTAEQIERSKQNEYSATEPLPSGFDYASWDRTESRVHAAVQPLAPSADQIVWKMGDRRATRTTPCLLFAVCCALNVLTKGLIGVVFPVGIVLLYLLITRGPRGALRRIGNLHPVASLLVFLAVAAPWHILIGLANPTQGSPLPITHLGGAWQVPLPTDGNVHGWFWFYFVNEHLLRYLNLRVPRDYDTVPLALFWGLLLVWLMPWSAFLFHAFARVPLWKALRQIPWKIADRRGTSRAGRAGSPADRKTAGQSSPASSPGKEALTPLAKTKLLLGLWALVPLLFFSLSTRQEYYVLPSMPALILLIAAWLAASSLWNNFGERPSREGLGQSGVQTTTGENQLTHVTSAGIAANHIASALFALGTLLSLALCFFLFRSSQPAPSTDLSTLLQQNPGDYALSMGHFLDLNAQALGLFRIPLALTAAALFLGSFANWFLRRHGRPHAATLSLAAASFIFLLAAHLGLQTFSPVLSSERMAAAIAPQVQPDDLIILHGEYEAGSTLGFYLRRNDLHLCEGRSSNLWYGSFFPDAPKIFETRESVAEKWRGAQRIFLWQDPSDKDRPVLKLEPSYVVASSGGKQILSNRPNR